MYIIYCVIEFVIIINVYGKKGLRKTALPLKCVLCDVDEGLLQLSKGCSSLTALSLYWNVKYTDVGISAIAKSLPMRPPTLSPLS